MLHPSHLPFGYFAIPHFCLWRFAGAGGVLFYIGRDAATIDYASPIAGAAAGSGSARLPVTLHPRQPQVIATRAVAPSGTMEHNTHVLLQVTVDEAGQLQTPALASVTDLVIAPSLNGSAMVEFSCQPRECDSPPTSFEVFAGTTVDAMDLDSPLITVPFVPGRRDYCTAILLEPPSIVGVRSRHGDRTGPLATVAVTKSPAPPPPIPYQLS